MPRIQDDNPLMNSGRKGPSWGKIWAITLCVILGIVVDPTTAGVNDSQRAMSYEEPWQDPTIEEE